MNNNLWGEMLRGVAHCKRVISGKRSHPWQQQIFAKQPRNHFFCNSYLSFSSSSRKNSSLHNYYIRKRRKWPIKPYKTEWEDSFAYQLAKQSFKQSIRKCKSHLLSDLINSCAAYEIDPTPQSYHFLVKIVIRAQPSNWSEQIREILDHIERVENFETNEAMFIDLIKFFGENHMFNDAVELFFRMQSFRCEPSMEVFDVLLTVLCGNEKGLEIVPQLLVKSQMMKLRVLQESSFGILTRALCRIGRVDSAFEMLNHMVEEGFGVDQRICSIILATKCRQLINCNNNGDIMGFLEDLKRLGFVPRKCDFSNLIKLFVKGGKILDAVELLKQMKINGIKPDIMCYNLVLDGLVHNGDFLNADKMFDEMLVLGLFPDINTYNVYIYGLCMQKKVDDGLKMMYSMEELGCTPDSCTYSIVLRALCEALELQRAREVANEMQQKGVQPNQHTREIIQRFLPESGLAQPITPPNIHQSDNNCNPLDT